MRGILYFCHKIPFISYSNAAAPPPARKASKGHNPELPIQELPSSFLGCRLWEELDPLVLNSQPIVGMTLLPDMRWAGNGNQVTTEPEKAKCLCGTRVTSNPEPEGGMVSSQLRK